MKKIIACTSMAVLLLTVVFVGEAYQDQEGTRVAEKTLVSKETGSGVPNWIKPDEEYLNYYDMGVFDTTLPILHINTNGQQISKENKILNTIFSLVFILLRKRLLFFFFFFILYHLLRVSI